MKYKVIALGIVFSVFVSVGVSYSMSVPGDRNACDWVSHVYVNAIKINSDILENRNFYPFKDSSNNKFLNYINYNPIMNQKIAVKEQANVVNKVAKKKKPKKKKKLTAYQKLLKKFSTMAVADLGGSEEPLAMYNSIKKNKIKVGYLPDGATMTIVKSVKKWFKVKSGNITGFVKIKDLVVGQKAGMYMMENKLVTAQVDKNNVPLHSTPSKKGAAIGMGYRGGVYPVIKFSKDKKYVDIQRTESITGYLPVSAVKLKVDNVVAMTKAEYDQYLNQLRIEEEKALNDYLHLKVSSSGNALQDNIVTLIAHNESGNYKAARNAKIGAEKTITVGAWQWYGENAHNILRLIYSANSTNSKKMISKFFIGKKGEEKAEKLCKDIVGRTNWESTRRKFTRKEIIAIKELLGSNQGVKVQNEKIHADIRIRISGAIRNYKLTNDGITAYYCDLFWQSPNNARRIIRQCIKHFKSSKKFCEDKDGLKYFHETAMKNGVMKRYAMRRNYTYAYCKRLVKK